MLIKRSRRKRGAALVLVAALLVILSVLTVGLLKLANLLGGGRQLQNATDAGNLSVARGAATKIGVSLNNGQETDNFAAFENANGQIDLSHFNGVVGQCVWVALNAQSENTATAASNCQTVLALAEGTDNSIGQRLLSTLSDSTQMDPYFMKLATNNPTGALAGTVQPNDGSYAVGFMNTNGLTNIGLDQSNAPMQADGQRIQLPSNLLSKSNSSSGFPYVNGYNSVSFNLNQGHKVNLSGVSVQPMQAPHLVANADFDAHTSQPIQGLSLPPNAFQSVASNGTQSQAKKGPETLGTGGIATIKMTSSSIVGLLQDSVASIPHGYIKIVNGTGDSDNSPLPSNQSIFNNQLFTGIFVANNGAFSTDESQIQAWADYNNNHVGQAPPLAELYNVQGNPATQAIAGAITSLGGNGYPALCDYTNVQGPDAVAAAAALLPSFENAYPAPIADGSSGCYLTAVEKLKAEVMELYTSGTGGTPSDVTTTGMRYFDHTATYVAGAGQSPQFTRPGTLIELLNQADQAQNTAQVDPTNPLIVAIKQRMREIKPAATDAEMNQVLTGNTVDLGQTFYLWMDDTQTFRMTQSAPQWSNGSANTGVTPDGSPQVTAVNFPTIGKSVDPIGECGFNQTLFAVQPDSATDYLGIDSATWTPSTGTSNLLGTLNLSESISGTAIVLQPRPPIPPPPPPPSCGGPWAGDVQNYIDSIDQQIVNGYGQGSFWDAINIYGASQNQNGILDSIQQQVMQLGQGNVTSVSFSSHAGDYSTNYFDITVTTKCGTETAGNSFWYNN